MTIIVVPHHCATTITIISKISFTDPIIEAKTPINQCKLASSGADMGNNIHFYTGKND
jgi:hypothetical protein